MEQNRAFAVVGCSLIGASIACGGAALDNLPPWSIELADGTVVHEYRSPLPEERQETIEAVEELVIGGGGGGEPLFFQLGPVVADGEGRIWAMDADARTIMVFDADGELQMTLGGHGQGPGELDAPTRMTIAGGVLVVGDLGNRRFGTWSLEGEHLGDRPFDVERTLLDFDGLDDGTLVGRRRIPRQAGTSLLEPARYMLGVYGLDGDTVAEILDLGSIGPPRVLRGSPASGRVSMAAIALPTPFPSYAATPDGDVYATLAADYEVFAYDASGTMRWALRAAWPRRPIGEDEVREAMERARERIPDLSRSEFEAPTHRPGLQVLHVDGHGHLWVFPAPPTELQDPPGRPVDVYDRDGRLLFAGWYAGPLWSSARGDRLYSRRFDRETDEQAVTRHRLVEPFD